MSRTERIRALNDALRTTFRGGRVLTTSGVSALPPEHHAAVLDAVRAFDIFNAENDPYGEHDFGSLQVAERTFFWKINCHDTRMEGGSEDPADPTRTTRVLTIMLAEEY